MRLDKYLSNIEVASRSQSKVLIKNKKVKVNGEIIASPEYHINENSDIIEVQGKNLSYEKFTYYMLNKPAGIISAVSDFKEKTVLDLLDIKPKKGLFPVGRLDKDTEGLLIITNNGQLAHDLLSPKKHINKTYYVELNGCLITEDIESFSKGIDIGEKALTKPAILEIISSGNNSKAYITITEGKYHQVKRMFQAIGLKVTYLKRISMANIVLDENLKVGEYRKLTDKEVFDLENTRLVSN